MKQRVFNLIILDESGSMRIIEKQAIGAVNETIQTIRHSQKEHEDQEHFLSLVVFNSCEVKTVYDCMEIDRIEELPSDQYRPTACTPLYDAMGNAITALRQKVADADSVLVTIVTDGYENSSREYTGEAIYALVDSLKAKGWLFAYIGANQDADRVGRSMGIRSTLSFDATCESTEEMGMKMSKMVDRAIDYSINLSRGDYDEELNLFDENPGLSKLDK